MKRLFALNLWPQSMVFLACLFAAGLAHAQTCTWVGVEKAGINSHQPGQSWCAPGYFMVALDLDGPRNYSAHDSPVVGQVQCCSMASGQATWQGTTWVGVEKAGINSHQPGQPWCSPGEFLVALDLDGPRNYSDYDSPVIGQAMCASSGTSRYQNCRWTAVENARINSHQPGPSWCPSGTFLVALDLDSRRNYGAHDSPVIGQAMCCSP